MIIKYFKERTKILHKIKIKFTGGADIKASKIVEISGNFKF